jgi:DNA primase
MRIPESKLAEVAAAADIVQVISQYVELKKAGKDYRGLCPFHGDKDPSFYVSPQKGIFHCFGCAVGGSVFNFVMKVENISFVDAVRLLAQRHGIPLLLEQHSQRFHDEKSRVFAALEAAQEYFVARLRSSVTPKGYLEDRGVPNNWVDELGLGFAPDSWDGIQEHLRAAGIAVQDAVAAGLVKPRAGNNGYYDHFRSRLMIPIRDLNSRIVAFGGRILGEGEPKYLNSPENPVFRKRSVLYGLDAARDGIRREGFLVLVEGYFDQISLRIRGLDNAVAPLGTALGTEQIRLIKRFTDNVITVFDADEAGLRAVKRAIPLFLAEGFEPRCLILEGFKDPDEAINTLGTEAFRSLLEGARPMVEFLLDSIEAQYDLGTIRGRNLAVAECMPVLREIADSTEADYLIERFSARLRVREERLRGMLRKAPQRRSREDGPAAAPRKSLFDFPADERNVVRGMLMRDGFIDRVIEMGVLKELEDPVLSLLAEKMVGFREGSHAWEPGSFCMALEDDQLASIVAGWLKPRPEEDDLRPEFDGDKAIDQSLDSIRRRKLEQRKADLKERMRQCVPGEEEYNNLARELMDLGRRLHAR